MCKSTTRSDFPRARRARRRDDRQVRREAGPLAGVTCAQRGSCSLRHAFLPGRGGGSGQLPLCGRQQGARGFNAAGRPVSVLTAWGEAEGGAACLPRLSWAPLGGGVLDAGRVTVGHGEEGARAVLGFSRQPREEEVAC